MKVTGLETYKDTFINNKWYVNIIGGDIIV